MASWQWLAIGVTAFASVGVMAMALLGLFPRDPGGLGTRRRSTRLEAGLVGEVPAGRQRLFDGWSYRVQARFAGRVRVLVDGDAVSVAGPRAPATLYRVWLWAQGLLVALAPVAFMWAFVTQEWQGLLVGAGLLVASWTVSVLGAGLWPGLGELSFPGDADYEAVEFPLDSVTDVTIGEGWARDGMATLLFVYKRAVDAMARGRAVSFSAPDGEGHHVRYAIHMTSEDDARELAGILEGMNTLSDSREEHR